MSLIPTARSDCLADCWDTDGLFTTPHSKEYVSDPAEHSGESVLLQQAREDTSRPDKDHHFGPEIDDIIDDDNDSAMADYYRVPSENDQASP
ncbi:hypothetical protein MMC31_001817 [Peltigera leucophlebia]|nr:hypothetical protein [Peltigera leucophlebia]